MMMEENKQSPNWKASLKSNIHLAENSTSKNFPKGNKQKNIQMFYTHTHTEGISAGYDDTCR
jgi:hypothetical protein